MEKILLNKKVVLVCGEKSGDNLAIDLISTLKELGCQEIAGVGGIDQEKLGVTLWYKASSLQVIGFWEVIKKWFTLKKITNGIIKKTLDFEADLFIGVDMIALNLFLQQHFKKKGIPCLQYACPKFWAWNYRRVYSFHKRTDAILCLFPFEQKLLAKHDMPSFIAGHFLANRVASTREEACRELGIEQDKKVVSLFPGSRESEIKMILPVHLELAEKFTKSSPEKAKVIILIAALNQEIADKTQQIIDDYNYHFDYRILVNQTNLVIDACHFAVATSGTITLELMLAGKPMSVIYNLSFWDYCIAYFFLRDGRAFSLPNYLNSGQPTLEAMPFFGKYKKKNIERVLENMEKQFHYTQKEQEEYKTKGADLRLELKPRKKEIFEALKFVLDKKYNVPTN